MVKKLHIAVLILGIFVNVFSSVDGATTNPCDGKEGIIPNPEVDDCSSYIQCAKDFYDVLTCSSGLLFNTLKRTCDYSTNVDCPDDGQPEEPQNKISLPSSDVQCETDTCTCVYPSEYSCSEYYRCENGIAYKEECPGGLYMNIQKLTCDYKENVNCSYLTSETTELSESTNGLSAETSDSFNNLIPLDNSSSINDILEISEINSTPELTSTSKYISTFSENDYSNLDANNTNLPVTHFDDEALPGSNKSNSDNVTEDSYEPNTVSGFTSKSTILTDSKLTDKNEESETVTSVFLENDELGTSKNYLLSETMENESNFPVENSTPLETSLFVTELPSTTGKNLEPSTDTEPLKTTASPPTTFTSTQPELISMNVMTSSTTSQPINTSETDLGISISEKPSIVELDPTVETKEPDFTQSIYNISEKITTLSSDSAGLLKTDIFSNTETTSLSSTILAMNTGGNPVTQTSTESGNTSQEDIVTTLKESFISTTTENNTTEILTLLPSDISSSSNFTTVTTESTKNSASFETNYSTAAESETMNSTDIYFFTSTEIEKTTAANTKAMKNVTATFSETSPEESVPIEETIPTFTESISSTISESTFYTVEENTAFAVATNSATENENTTYEKNITLSTQTKLPISQETLENKTDYKSDNEFTKFPNMAYISSTESKPEDTKVTESETATKNETSTETENKSSKRTEFETSVVRESESSTQTESISTTQTSPKDSLQTGSETVAQIDSKTTTLPSETSKLSEYETSTLFEYETSTQTKSEVSTRSETEMSTQTESRNTNETEFFITTNIELKNSTQFISENSTGTTMGYETATNDESLTESDPNESNNYQEYKTQPEIEMLNESVTQISNNSESESLMHNEVKSTIQDKLKTTTQNGFESSTENTSKSTRPERITSTQTETKTSSQTIQSEMSGQTEFQMLTETQSEATTEFESEMITQTESETSLQAENETPTQSESEIPTQTESEAPTQTEFEMPFQTESEKPAKTEPEASARTESEAPTQTETETPTQTETKMSTQTEPEMPTQTESETPTQSDSEIPTQTESETPTPSESEPPNQTESETPIQTESEIPTQTESEAPTQTEFEMPIQTESEKPAKTEPKASARTESEAPTQTEPQTPTQTEFETTTQTESKTPIQTEFETTTQTESETPTQTESETPTQTESETPSQTESETSTQTESETPTQTESEPPTQTESEPLTQTEPETQTQTETVTPPQTDSETPAQTEFKTPTQTESETQTQTESKTQTQTEPKTATQTDSEIQTQPESENPKFEAEKTTRILIAKSSTKSIFISAGTELEMSTRSGREMLTEAELETLTENKVSSEEETSGKVSEAESVKTESAAKQSTSTETTFTSPKFAPTSPTEILSATALENATNTTVLTASETSETILSTAYTRFATKTSAETTPVTSNNDELKTSTISGVSAEAMAVTSSEDTPVIPLADITLSFSTNTPTILSEDVSVPLKSTQVTSSEETFVVSTKFATDNSSESLLTTIIKNTPANPTISTSATSSDTTPATSIEALLVTNTGDLSVTSEETASTMVNNTESIAFSEATSAMLLETIYPEEIVKNSTDITSSFQSTLAAFISNASTISSVSTSATSSAAVTTTLENTDASLKDTSATSSESMSVAATKDFSVTVTDNMLVSSKENMSSTIKFDTSETFTERISNKPSETSLDDTPKATLELSTKITSTKFIESTLPTSTYNFSTVAPITSRPRTTIADTAKTFPESSSTLLTLSEDKSVTSADAKSETVTKTMLTSSNAILSDETSVTSIEDLSATSLVVTVSTSTSPTLTEFSETSISKTTNDFTTKSNIISAESIETTSETFLTSSELITSEDAASSLKDMLVTDSSKTSVDDMSETDASITFVDDTSATISNYIPVVSSEVTLGPTIDEKPTMFPVTISEKSTEAMPVTTTITKAATSAEVTLSKDISAMSTYNVSTKSSELSNFTDDVAIVSIISASEISTEISSLSSLEKTSVTSLENTQLTPSETTLTTFSEATSTTFSEAASTTFSEATSATFSEATSATISEATSTTFSEATSTTFSEATSTTFSEAISTTPSKVASTPFSETTLTTPSEFNSAIIPEVTSTASSEDTSTSSKAISRTSSERIPITFPETILRTSNQYISSMSIDVESASLTETTSSTFSEPTLVSNSENTLVLSSEVTSNTKTTSASSTEDAPASTLSITIPSEELSEIASDYTSATSLKVSPASTFEDLPATPLTDFSTISTSATSEPLAEIPIKSTSMLITTETSIPAEDSLRSTDNTSSILDTKSESIESEILTITESIVPTEKEPKTSTNIGFKTSTEEESETFTEKETSIFTDNEYVSSVTTATPLTTNSSIFTTSTDLSYTESISISRQSKSLTGDPSYNSTNENIVITELDISSTQTFPSQETFFENTNKTTTVNLQTHDYEITDSTESVEIESSTVTISEIEYQCTNCKDCIMPDKTDCSKYLHCKNGSKINMQCPVGYLFNSLSKECDTFDKVSCSFVSKQCPDKEGIFPDPKNCSSFVHCYHGIAYEKTCPTGLFYNPTKRTCDLNSECGIQPSLLTSRNHDVKCECENCALPDSDDCSKYYLCLNNTAYEMECGDGLHFNPEISNCDYVDKVSCATYSPVCLEKNGFLPNAENCSAYYHCVGGVAYPKSCNGNNHFSISTESCEDPCEAECDNSIDCSKPTTLPVSVCKEPNGFYPHPTNCNKFYKCVDYHPILSECIGSEHFSPFYEICQNPCDALCDLKLDCVSVSIAATLTNADYLSTTSKTTNITTSDLITLSDVPDETHSTSSEFYTTIEERQSNSSIVPLIFETTRNSITDEDTSKITYSTDTAVASLSTTNEPYFTRLTAQTPGKYTSSMQPEILSTGTPSICDGGDGVIPKPGDCTSLIVCILGKPREMRCPVGLHFSPTTKHCEYPCTAKCDLNFDCFSSGEPISSTALPLTICPVKDFLPVQGYCSYFYNCTHGVQRKVKCPPRLHFNPTSRVCDFPSRANCGKPANKLYHPDRHVKCPCETCILPSTENCQAYYLCLNKIAYRMTCSNGLLFDWKKNTCTFADTATCYIATISEPVSTAPSTTVSKTTTSKQFKCPQRNGMFRNPNNCGSFMHCSNWWPYVKACPGKLHFSTRTERCEYPCFAKCDTNLPCVATQQPEATTGIPGLTPDPLCLCINCRQPSEESCTKYIECKNGKPSFRTCPRGQTFDSKRRACDWAHRVDCRHSDICFRPNGLFPYKGDCHKFVHCSNGIPYIKKCPAGLEFDSQTLRCEWPSGKCSKSVTSTSDISYILQPSEWKCPSSYGYFRDDKECNNFYICVNGAKHLQTCSRNLLFNTKYNTCDWPKNVKCGDEHKHSQRQCRVFDRHVECLGNRTNLANPHCDMFYDCLTGRPCARRCPKGLYFNAISGICDEPQNVKCSTSDGDWYSLKDFSDMCKRKKRGHMKDPGNSSCYYRCDHEKVIRGCCSRSRIFDERWNKCVWHYKYY